MEELDNCGNCGEEVATDSDFCPYCGVLFEKAPAVSCEFDHDREADAVCIICQKPVCVHCASLVQKRWFCGEHSTVEVQEGWAKVLESPDSVLIGAMKTVLADSGFEVIDQNWRARGGRKSRLFVPVADYLKAVQLLKETQS